MQRRRKRRKRWRAHLCLNVECDEAVRDQVVDGLEPFLPDEVLSIMIETEVSRLVTKPRRKEEALALVLSSSGSDPESKGQSMQKLILSIRNLARALQKSSAAVLCRHTKLFKQWRSEATFSSIWAEPWRFIIFDTLFKMLKTRQLFASKSVKRENKTLHSKDKQQRRKKSFSHNQTLLFSFFVSRTEITRCQKMSQTKRQSCDRQTDRQPLNWANTLSAPQWITIKPPPDKAAKLHH